MNKSPLVKAVAMGSWAITSLSAINMGLAPLGMSLFRWVPMGMMAPLHYLIGLAGVVSLAMLVKACGCCGGCGKCGTSACTC